MLAFPFRSVRAGAAIILRGVECRGRDGSAVAIVCLPGVEVLNCGLWERWRTIGGSLLILRTIGSCVEISAGAAAVLCNVCSTAGDWLLWFFGPCVFPVFGWPWCVACN